jgi:hypothetical protein
MKEHRVTEYIKENSVTLWHVFLKSYDLLRACSTGGIQVEIESRLR